MACEVLWFTRYSVCFSHFFLSSYILILESIKGSAKETGIPEINLYSLMCILNETKKSKIRWERWVRILKLFAEGGLLS